MNSAVSVARCIVFIVFWSALGAGQTPDLTPLLPPTDPATLPVRAALMAGEVDRAAVIATSLAPASRDLWLGILAITKGDATSAIRFLRRVDQPKPLGVAYYLARQHVLFRQQMAEAIRRDPGDFGPYYYLGRHFDSDVGNPEEAARWFGLALERNQSYARARSHLGNCLERLGRLTEAEAAYQASTGIPESLLGLARLRLAGGEPLSALEYAERALAGAPRDPSGLQLAARIYEELKRPRDAVIALQRAAKVAPHNAAIRYRIFRLSQSLGDDKKAAEALREFERLRSIYGLQPQ